MKFGILHMTTLLFICLNFQFGYSKDSLDIELEELAELDDLDAMFEQAVWEEIQEVTTAFEQMMMNFQIYQLQSRLLQSHQEEILQVHRLL